MDIRLVGEIELILMVILSVLLIVSELLAWSNCKPNSISQYLYTKLICSVPEDENDAATQTPQSL